MNLQGPYFSDSRDPVFPDSRDQLIIFSDSRDPILNSRDPNRVFKTLKRNLAAALTTYHYEANQGIKHVSLG